MSRLKIIDLQLTATKHILILLLLICMVITRTDCFAVETLAIEATGLKEVNLTGRVIGTTGNKLFVAGGSTVDGTWCDTINYLEKNMDGSYVWRESSVRLPVALSSAGTFSSSDGLYIAGGLTREGPSDFCCILFWNKENSKLEIKVLPRLPIPLVSPAVALVDQTLYVVGGFTDAECKIPSDTFFAIKAGQSMVTANTWRTLPVLPMGARGGAVTAVQNHEAGKALFLFGGHALNDQSEVAPQSDGWYYLPVKESWFPVMEEDNKPFDHYVNAAVATGTTHILFPGHVGFKGNFAEGQDQSSTATERNIYAYNTITKMFFLQDAAERDLPAEATPVRWDNAIVLVAKSWGGEQSQSNILRLQIYQQKNNLGTLNILVMVIYFGLLAWMGYYFAKRQKGTEDYFRGGHRVPWWIVGISIFGTTTSAISYMAVPAKVYMTNWSYFTLAFAPVLFSPFIIYFLIPNLRKYNLTSAYEYLEYRFNVVIRTLGSGIFISFQIVRMAVMLFLPAIALNVVTNFDIYLCITVVGVVSLVYTMFGGIEAVIWTDVLQVVILIGGLILALAVISFNLDTSFVESARIAMANHKTSLGSVAVNFKEPTFWTILVSSFFLFVIPFSSDQSLVQRYFVSKTDKEASGGLWVNAWLTLPCSILLFLLGVAFYLFYKANPTELSVVMDNNDSLLPWFVISQLPEGVSGLLIVAIFAASMSSLSASMNAISAAWTTDFHERLFHCSKQSSLRTAKFVTLISGLFGITVALAMVTWDISSFWDEYNRLLGLLTSGLAGLFFLGILSKRANSAGALIGLAVSIIVQMYVMDHKSVYILLYSGTGFVSCIVAGILGSYFFPAPVVKVPIKEEYITGAKEDPINKII